MASRQTEQYSLWHDTYVRAKHILLKYANFLITKLLMSVLHKIQIALCLLKPVINVSLCYIYILLVTHSFIQNGP